MAEYRVDHPRFQRQQLVLRTNLFWNPKLFLNGAEVKRQRGAFEVTDDGGVQATIKLRGGLDFQPRAVVDGGTPIRVGPRLPAYAYIFIYLPFSLAFVGGALGGACGAVAGVGSAAVFQSERSTAAKIGLSTLMASAAFVVYAVVGGMVHTMLE